MKNDPVEIEAILRRAPTPSPPPSLRDRVQATARTATISHPRGAGVGLDPKRRWWPALAAAGLALASLGLVAMQHAQIKALRQSVESLQQQIETLQATPQVGRRSGAPARTRHQPIHVPLPNGRVELEQLRVGTEKLRAQIERREGLAAENARLEKELDTLARQAHPEVYAAIDAAKAEAARTRCVNNLKLLGVAARIYATDNDDRLPPNIMAMSNDEVNSLKTLICPADTGRQAAASWEEFTPANSSYEFLAANGSETEPLRVMFRCRIHGFVTLCDGSVRRLSEQAQREQLESRDGKLWFNPAPPPSLSGNVPGMDRLMMERYGLLPTATTNPPPIEDPYSAAQSASPAAQAPQMDRLMMQRYGLLPRDEPVPDEDAPKENPQ